jgi:tripartite-type tricarboxylate transporter receptor subunit TctC
MFARKEVPAPALDVIRKAVKQAVTDPQFTNASMKMQMPPAYLEAPEFQKWFDNDCARLSAAIRRIPPAGAN